MNRPLAAASAVSLIAMACPPVARAADPWHGIDHIVVIFQENHSLDNVYGRWGDFGGQEVNGIGNAPPDKTIQVAQDGSPLVCLLVLDVNMASPSPLPTTCTDALHPAVQGEPPTAQPVNSHFGNGPFAIDDFVPPSATTCPDGGEDGEVRNGTGSVGGCTSDMVHRFYQEQYQFVEKPMSGDRVTGEEALAS